MHNLVSNLIVLKKLGVPGSLKKSLKIIPVHWSLFAVGWIKVNTNQATNGSPGLAGGIGVFRNHFGTVMGYFLCPLGSKMAFVAKLETIIQALKFDKLHGCTHIWLEADSFYTVQLLSSHSIDVLWFCCARWFACLRFIFSYVTRIFCEGNKVAYLLSKAAIQAHFVTWSHILPNFCLSTHLGDLGGNCNFRFSC